MRQHHENSLPVWDAVDNGCERTANSSGVKLLSVAGWELLLLAPSWLRLLLAGAVGGLMIGWLLIRIESSMQKWIQRKEKLNHLFKEKLVVTEALAVELQSLIEDRNVIDHIEKKRLGEYLRIKEAYKYVSSYKKHTEQHIKSVKKLTEKVRKDWFSFPLETQKEIVIAIEIYVKDWEKENDTIYIRIPRWSYLLQKIQSVVFFVTASKSYRVQLNEIKAELEDVRISLDTAWLELINCVATYISIDQLGSFYNLINPIEIAEFIKRDNDLKPVLIETFKKIVGFFKPNEINLITLQLVSFSDDTNSRSLVISIYSSLEIELAYSKLVEFKETIWIDFVGDLLPKLSVDIFYDI